MVNKPDEVCKDAAKELASALAATELSNWEDSVDAYGRAVNKMESALVTALCNQAAALSHLERHVTSLEVAQHAAMLAPKSPVAHYWQATAHEKMGALDAATKAYRTAASHEKDLATRMTYSDGASRCAQAAADKKAAAARQREAENGALESQRTKAAAAAAARANVNSSAPITPAAATGGVSVNNVRMDWYQSASVVSVDIFAKGVDRAASSVKITPRGLNMKLVRPDKEDYLMTKELFEEVDPEASSWSASKYKVELRLRKKVSGVTWVALDVQGEVASAGVRASALAQKRKEKADEKQKLWNAKADEELKDYKEDDSAMSVFRQIYSNVDEDTRRAMVKSYSESGGQVLSTDWSKVQKEKVVYKPVGERNNDSDDD